MPKPYLSASEVEEAHDETSWGSLRWLASREVGNAEGLTLGRVVIRSGRSNPRHCHPSCEEVLYLLSGRLEHTLGDETFTLRPGDTLSIPPGVFHNARSTGEEDAEMIVAYSTGERDFVLEGSR
ncbi:MAG: cupin domain-containing protein [Armatimonadetes bacterium]|nr:cupin domain-containing protein [Armatimonadota bacterium]